MTDERLAAIRGRVEATPDVEWDEELLLDVDIRRFIADARLDVRDLLGEVASLRAERDHLLVKAEAMHLVISALSLTSDITDARLVETLDSAEIHVRALVQTPEGRAQVRVAVGLPEVCP